jgi:coronin-7
MPLIHAHTDMVTDFQFAPFDDGLLATGSQDMMVKLWRIPPGGLGADGLSQPELTLPQQPRRVETIDFNPAVDSILATSSFDQVNVWDLIKGEEVFCFVDHDDEVQSVSWQTSGKLLATQCKDKTLRILDPRAANPLVAECESHQGIKDSKVVFIGDANRVLTTGFSGDRLREINIRDMRNLAVPEKNLTLDMSSG